MNELIDGYSNCVGGAEISVFETPALSTDTKPARLPNVAYMKGYPYWRASKRCKDAGYRVRSVRLRGTQEDVDRFTLALQSIAGGGK